MGRALRSALALAGLVLVAAPLPSAASLSAAGSFSPAPSMRTAREGHTATLLTDGRVLICGGDNGLDQVLRSCELFDPRANRWAPAAPMETPREGHTATLLPDGRVLVVGGISSLDEPVSLASAELYDPTRNRWTPATPVFPARTQHSATRLRDGRILVAGGATFTGLSFPPVTLAAAETYDPLTNSWTTQAPMPAPRQAHATALLPDGTVLVLGGLSDGSVLASAALYEPSQNAWRMVGAMSSGRAWPTATVLATGGVLVAGGEGNPGVNGGFPQNLGTTERFVARDLVWRPAADLNELRFRHSATRLPSGAVLVVGGLYLSHPPAELYDPATDRWTEVPGTSIQRYDHTATLLNDGQVLIAGGHDPAVAGALQSAALYSSAGAVNPAGDVRWLPVIIIVGVLLLSSAGWRFQKQGRLAGFWPRDRSTEWIDP